MIRFGRLLGISALVLSACSAGSDQSDRNLADNILSGGFERLRSVLTGLSARPAADPNVPPASEVPATRAQIDAVGVPLIYGYLETIDAGTSFSAVAVNRDTVTWLNGDNITMTFRRGVLIATRGFGDDLMSADVSGTLALLASGQAGTVPRVHRYLDGEDQVVARSFTCRVLPVRTEVITIVERQHRTRLLSEACENATLSFENLYWIDLADGQIMKSRQYINYDRGSMDIQRLIK